MTTRFLYRGPTLLAEFDGPDGPVELHLVQDTVVDGLPEGDPSVRGMIERGLLVTPREQGVVAGPALPLVEVPADETRGPDGVSGEQGGETPPPPEGETPAASQGASATLPIPEADKALVRRPARSKSE